MAHSTRPAGAAPRELPDESTLRADLRERRERVIDAAMRLMVAEDYQRIQIKDVAVEADVALGTLYRYFNSKDHVFACALAKWASSFGDRIDRTQSSSRLETVTNVYRRAARAFERQPRVFDVLVQLQGSADPFAAEVYSDFARRQNETFASALDGIEDPERSDIVAVMGAVLSEGLRQRQLGLATFAEVHRRIARAAELILG